MKKANKKLASAIVLGLMLAVPVGASAAEVDYDELKDTVSAGFVAGYSNFTDSEYIFEKNASGRVYGIFATDEKVANVSNENIYIKVSNDDLQGDTYGVAAAILKKDDDFTHGGTVNLGTDDTKNIYIAVDASGYATGITAMRHINNNDAKPAFVNVKGENLIIDVHSDKTTAAGIWTQNNTGDPSNPSTVTINADNTFITTTSGNNDTIGIAAMSSSKVVVNSNIYIDAKDAILARGNSTVKVNADGSHTTKLNGDINFNYNGPTSGTTVDANVIVNLTGADSYWNGNTTVTWDYIDNKKPDDDMLKVQDFKLTIADGAQWNPNKIDRTDRTYTDNNQKHVTGGAYLALNDLTLNGGIINLDKDKMGDQALKIEKLGGTGGIVNTNSLKNSIEIDKLVAGDGQPTPSITVNGSGNIADEMYKDKDNEENIAQDLANVVTSGEKSVADKVTTDEGIIAGRYSFEVGDNGKVDPTSGSYTKNTKNEAISNMASIGLMAWRAENNDMNKRLGELRNSNGEHGVWARMVRGESEYGAQSIKNQYNTYQLGYDEKLSTNDNWTVGAAISYTDGQSSFENGSGENTSKGLSFYGSYLGDNGEFVDLIAKYARLDNEFDVAGGVGSGDYSTNGYSFSAEYGKRTQLANDFYIEPQVELTYGRVADVDFVTKNGAKVSQDSMDSLVGRVGLAAGKNIKNGNVYVRASYLYDFDGETNVTFSNAGASESFSEDLGGGWFEFGIGTNINLSDATYLYFDVEKTTGGEVDTNWQWNAGVRYSF